MAERPYTQFYAKMLGGFSLSYRGREIQFDAKLQTKYMQLLLMMIKAGREGVEKKELLEILPRGDGDGKKQLNNLRQQFFLLRKVINQANLPEGTYIVHKDSRYYFTLDYDLETDTGYLDQILRQIRSGPGGGKGRPKEERQELLRKFCKGYTGEFLPMLNGEEWVTVESAYYQKWYFDCLKQLCEILKEQGDYEEMLELCTAASQMHPYDGWQAVEIECLMAMNRYKEALRIYEDATQIFYEDLGITAIDQVMAKYRNESGRFYYAASALTNVKDVLKETEKVEGAYCCSYPSFLDIYHIISRMKERVELSSLLMICTMKIKAEEGALSEDQDAFSKTKNEWEQLEPEMGLLQQAIANGVRSGDVYTRYSANQFLVLLIGADEQNGAAIAARLEQRWRQISRNGKTEISFTVQAVEDPRIEGYENAEERNIRSTYL